MSNELALPSVANLPAVTDVDFASSDYKELLEGGFLRRIQFFAKAGETVESGKIVAGHYGIVNGQEIIDLGNTLDIIIFAYRQKALDLVDRKNPIVSFIPKSDLYQDIKARSKETQSNCQEGFTFLVFERTTADFYELFLGTKSGRIEGKKVRTFAPVTEAISKALKAVGQDEEPHGPLACTLSAEFLKRKFSYYVPVCKQCSQVFTRLPNEEQIVKAITKFMALKSTEVELAKDAPADRPR